MGTKSINAWNLLVLASATVATLGCIDPDDEDQPGNEPAAPSTQVSASEAAMDETFLDEMGRVLEEPQPRTYSISPLNLVRSDAPCVSAEMIDALAGDGAAHGSKSRTVGGFTTKDDYDNCHTQGVAYRASDKRFVVTCEATNSRAYIASFKSGQTSMVASHSWKKTSPVSEGKVLAHPSSTQLVNGLFPVAFAHDLDGGDRLDWKYRIGSRLQMFQLESDGDFSEIGPELSVASVSSVQSHPHISVLGMLQYPQDPDSKYVLGCDYSCDNVYLWRWSNTSGSFSYLGRRTADAADVTTWANAEPWAGYNSFNLLPACSDISTGSQDTYLLAAYSKGDDMQHFHLYQVEGPITDLRFRQVAWNRQGNQVPYAKEGVAVIPDPPRLHLLTFYKDFHPITGQLWGHERWFYNDAADASAPDSF